MPRPTSRTYCQAWSPNISHLTRRKPWNKDGPKGRRPNGADPPTTTTTVGDYSITAALGSLTATNYSFTFTNGTLTIGADGNPGYFRQKLFVYERPGEPCRVCGTPIRQAVLGQRSTYWCPKCQT